MLKSQVVHWHQFRHLTTKTQNNKQGSISMSRSVITFREDRNSKPGPGRCKKAAPQDDEHNSVAAIMLSVCQVPLTFFRFHLSLSEDAPRSNSSHLPPPLPQTTSGVKPDRGLSAVPPVAAPVALPLTSPQHQVIGHV